MTRTYLSKIILILTVLCQFYTNAKAQYAVGGSAGANLYNSVYWLTWDAGASGSTLISAPFGSNAGNVTNGTYIWQFSPTVRITAVVSNENFVGGTNMTSYTPGNYVGDGLNYLFSGNNQPFPRGVENSGLAAPYGGQVTFNIDVKVAILINGTYTDVVYPGMVIADAESIDSGGEYISGDTPNPVAWQLIGKRTENNAADDHYKMDLSNGGKSFKLYADLPPGNFGVQAVMFAHGARNLQNVSMKGSGLTAMAIGFVLPFDLGDEPLSYGTAGHYMDQFLITDYYPGDGTYAVVNYTPTPLQAKASVYIGADNVDPDGQPAGTVLANNDDLVGTADESTFNVAALPDIKVNQAGNIVLNLPVTNTKGVPATLYGWIDFNRDGVFSNDEVVTATIPANTNNQTFSLTFLNSNFANKIKTGVLYTRFRITTTPLIDDPATSNVDERSFSFAADGEAEDYKFKDILGVNISGTVYNDHNGGNDATISGTPIQYVGPLQLFAYLIDNTNTITNKATVQSDGTYSLLNSNNGNYLVVISTNDVAIGGSISGVQPTLPPSWKPSGEIFGTNNAGHAGIEPGIPNLQIQASTPGTSLDITGVNFALNQIPTTTNDAVTITINTPIVIDVPGNDFDPDGTLDRTTVLLIDPADNLKKAAVTIAGQGTFSINSTTGQVTFIPVATFTGKTSIFYTIKDDFGSESLNTLISVNVKPVGVDDVDQTPVSTAVTTIVTANDGASATGNTVTAGTLPLHGTIVVNALGTITYTPTAGYIGTDSYTYTLVTPDNVSSDAIRVVITVGAPKPIGLDDIDNTPINTSVTTNVGLNDPSAIGSTFAGATPPAHGSVVLGLGAGQITYTPAADFIGKDSYTYTLTNGGIVSDPIKVTINVKPVGVSDVDQTPVNSPVTTTVTTNDGASATGTTVTAGTIAPLHGSIVVNALGTITYTPTTNYVGTDTYTYTLTTGDGVVSDQITVTISINAKPVGADDAATTSINTLIAVTVTANDPSAAGSTVTVSSAPANGTAVVTGAGQITYTPAAGFMGKDTYKYTLTVGGVLSDPITVTISVKPVGVNDVDQTPFNTSVTTTVKANDGASGIGTTVTAAITPLHGSIVVNASGAITYTPTAGYTGPDSYTYTLTTNDGVVSDQITVNITVGSKPVGLDDVGTTPINTAITTTVTANDPSAAGSTVTVASAPSNGTVVSGPGAGQITYTPAAGFTGKDVYTYTLTNGGVLSDPIKVTISVKPVGVDDVDQTPVNSPVTTVVKTNDGASGTGTTVTAGAAPSHGSIVINALGTITYTPTTNYVGIDTYKYTLTTADGVVSDPITVTITINAKPVGADDFGTTPINTAIATTVTANDPSAGSTVALAVAPAHGTVVLGPGAGVITYTPAAGFIGKDIYTYTLNNGGILSDQIKVTISVKPVGVDDADQTPVNTPVTVVVKTNDGASGTGTTVNAGTGPANGNIVVNASGSITYTPNTGYTGIDTYTYTLTTGDGVVSDPIKVTITVYSASMVLTKAANNSVSKVGDVINYTMIVYNTGTSALTNVVVADAGADAGSISPASISGLAAGALTTVTAKHTITQADVDAGFYSNQASVSAVDVKGNPVLKAKSDNPLTISTDDATVTIIAVPPVVVVPKVLKIPTLFTPNGDGINDVFEIRNLSDYAQNELTIVNRWGNEVYKQTDYQNTWTGDGLNEGTYYYVLRIKATGWLDWQVYKGYITLIRTFKK
jgi:gliding motility-associated-like protein